jgi:uncharacterized protein (TIGR03066 family)
MNALRLVAIGAVVCLLAGGARAEDKDDNAKLIVGKWEVTKADEGTVPTGMLIEFTKDGKVKLSGKKEGQDVNVEGTYKIDGKTFTVTMKRPDGEEHSQTITIHKLTDTEMETENKEGKKVTLTKKK